MITIYSKANCAYCDQAKALLESKDIQFTELRVDLDQTAREFIVGLGHRTVPQIFNDEHHVGGYPELRQYLQTQLINL